MQKEILCSFSASFGKSYSPYASFTKEIRQFWGEKILLLNQLVPISSSPHRSWIKHYIFDTIIFWTLQFGKIILISWHALSAWILPGHSDLADSISTLGCAERFSSVLQC